MSYNITRHLISLILFNSYEPYDRNINAKLYHMRRDGCIPKLPKKKKKPLTYIRRDFAGGNFPIHMSEDEYDELFKERLIRVDDYQTHLIPKNPSEYYLCYENEDGNERKIRNKPRN